MLILAIISLNLLVMGAVFLFGVYQFMQVEEKRKRRKLLAQAAFDEAEISALMAAEGYDEALARLMQRADVDRFTAESALEQWRRDGECLLQGSAGPGSSRAAD